MSERRKKELKLTVIVKTINSSIFTSLVVKLCTDLMKVKLSGRLLPLLDSSGITWNSLFYKN